MHARLSLAFAVLTGFALGALVVHAVHAQATPPAYTIAELEVTDPPTFQQYGKATGAGIPAAGGRFIVRGGKTCVINGAPPKQVVVIQWDSLEKAQAYFQSDAYKQLVPIRDKSSNFRAFVVEGVGQ